MGIRTGGILVALACVLAVGGCSGGNGAAGVPSLPGTPSTGASTGSSSLGEDAFTKCMKENGVDVNTPDREGEGKSESTSSPGDQSRYDQALEKCRKHMPDGGTNPRSSEEELRKAVEFAKCMRAKGVNYPDPDPNAGTGNGAVRIPEGVDGNDPVFREKMKTCLRESSGLVPEGGR